MASPAAAESVSLVYPPDGHETTAAQIFLIGTAADPVSVNGTAIHQSPQGHFAPSFPLQLGENRFTLQAGEATTTLTVIRRPTETPPTGLTFVPDSLTPAQGIERLPGESICLSAIAPPQSTVTARLSGQTFTLPPQPSTAQLPSNAAILTAQNDPIPLTTTHYQTCFTADQPGSLGQPTYTLTRSGETRQATAPGAIAILNPDQRPVVEVTAASGTARTGPSTTYSRLTPLPTGTRAIVTGREGNWLRLAYGAWINADETRVLPGAAAPPAMIRSLSGRPVDGGTEIVFPLTAPVPVSVIQGDDTFALTLHHAIAQTDTIWLNDSPLIRRLDWQQVNPTTLTYTFHLKTAQQWGYDLRYEGSSLRLLLRHPPQLSGGQLDGLRIVLDPGHGGAELGARGPDGTPEKTVNMAVSRQLQQALEARGATVYLTRTADVELGLRDRMDYIAQQQPDLALSVHYNALPDNGDAENTAGIGMFWYHPQAHDLAVFLHNYLVTELDRPSYGVFWNNLALTRPQIAPTILMELGFMINPEEFEWVMNPQAQGQLADAIAAGITQWVQQAAQP
jgi:N-acetylmuramoyl-L-alanine amidase